MKKKDVFNPDINPDYISDQLDYLNSHVWDRGYYKETEVGIWYEVFCCDDNKKDVKIIIEQMRVFFILKF